METEIEFDSKTVGVKIQERFYRICASRVTDYGLAL